MKYKLLGKELRLKVRSQARSALHQVAKASGREQDAINIAKVRVAIMARKYCEEKTGKFGSILTTFLVGLAVRLAVALIVYWVKQNFMSPPEGGFVKGEPGA